MELLELFLAGFALGLAVCWVYIRSLKAALKTCEAYLFTSGLTRSSRRRAPRTPPATAASDSGSPRLCRGGSRSLTSPGAHRRNSLL